jgi:mannose-6-phosphate isomerase-like protein (cupin superfamily)
MIAHHFSSGVYAKETLIPAGKWLIQHSHKHDHLSVLAQGTIELVVDGVSTVMSAPNCLTVAAGKHHGVRAVTDVVWYCIHATNCTDESEVDDVLIGTPDLEQVKAIAQILKEH